MEYLKLNNKPQLVQKEDLNTIDFVLLFPMDYDVDHLYDFKIMRQMVINTSLKYNTEQLFKKELLKRLIIDISMGIRSIHKTMFLEFRMVVPNPKLVKSFSLDSAFEFFIDTIMHPNVIDGCFDSAQFERNRDYLKSNMLANKKNIYSYTYQQFIKYFDNDGFLINTLGDNVDELMKCNPKDCYLYYQSIISEKPISFIYADIEESVVNDLFEKYYPMEYKNIEIEKNYATYLQPAESVNHIEENSKFKQSALYLGYKVHDMKYSDRIAFFFLEDILAGKENNLIFDALRMKNNLVYMSDVSSFSTLGSLYIETYLDSKDKDKAIKIISDVFESLLDEEYLKECMNKRINGLKYTLIRRMDSIYLKFNTVINNALEHHIVLEEIYDEYINLDVKELLDFIKRIKLDTIYFLRGEDNEEK